MTNSLIKNNGNSNQKSDPKKMGTVTYNLIQFNGNSNQQPDPK
jgi:hypothetical protein